MIDLKARILKTSFFVNVFFAIIILLVGRDALHLIYGLLFGFLIGILHFFELGTTLEKAVRMSPGKAQSYAVRKYIIRYVVTGIVIFVSVKAPYINVLGTILGLFSVKLAIYISNFAGSADYFKNIFKRKEG